MVNVPPVWNASRGSNDIPTMTQKMASEPNRHARCTISNAIRRICSMPALRWSQTTVRFPPEIVSLEPTAALLPGGGIFGQRPIFRNSPIAGMVRIAVPASHIHNDGTVELPLMPAKRS